MSSPQLLASLARIVGDAHLITAGDARLPRYLDELRGRYAGECLAVALPADTAQVAAVVAACAAARTSIVPQGGNTGAVGGAVARAGQVIVNLARLDAVEVDADNHSVRAGAGCILADLHAAAAQHGRLFPLSLGAQGSCQIGGNLATNAGGINVLRYGNARDLVLGVQVVLADGQVWDGMNALRKNNTGYDLKNLFVGSEGTLGIITAAVLKLFPLPTHRVVALAGVRDADAALKLLAVLRDATSDRLTTFELMAEIAVRTAVRHIATQTDPLRGGHRWYVLIAADSAGDDDDGLRRQVERCLARALEKNFLQDAVVAENETQATGLIRLRENIVEAQKSLGGSVKHDVAVPVAAAPELIRRADAAVKKIMPDALPYFYGHLGDGNLHLNISQPPAVDAQDFLAHRQTFNDRIHEITDDLAGTFSAEHGVGLARLAEMQRYKDPLTLALYRRLKQTLDPDDILNPGKVNP